MSQPLKRPFHNNLEKCPVVNFFGSIDYDEFYYQDLVDTKKILEEALENEEGEYEYQSSW